MFCNNCGTEYGDNESFCPNCGAAATPAAAPAEEAPAASNDIKSKIPVIAGAAVALIVVILIISALSGGGKKAVKSYFKAFGKFDGKKVVSMTAPKSVIEEMLDDKELNYDVDYKEAVSIYKKAYDELEKGLKDEGKVKFEYEIKEFENLKKLKKLDDDVEERFVYNVKYDDESGKLKSDKVEDLKSFQEYMEDDYDDYDLNAKKIKKAYAAEVKYTLTVDGDKVIKNTVVVIVYKYKGDWYVEGGPSIYSYIYGLDEDDFEDVIEDTNDILEDLFKTSKDDD